MKVTVTGANGFVGAQVVRSLVARGDSVQAVVRAGSDRGRLAGLADIDLVEADLLTETGRERITATKPDVCVHAAWYAEPGKYLSSLTNIDLQCGTLALARGLAEGGCRRFVGVGTCFEYDTSVGLLSERTPLVPAHLYSAAKAGTFLALQQLGALTGMQVAWARLFYLYGPGEHARRLVPSITQQLLRGEEARTTPGAQVRDFLHVEDAASGIVAVAHADVVGPVNVASGSPVTVAALVRELGALAGRPELVRIGAMPYPANEPMFICADIGKLSKTTGWAPRWSLSLGLADTLEWWRREGEAAARNPAAVVGTRS